MSNPAAVSGVAPGGDASRTLGRLARRLTPVGAMLAVAGCADRAPLAPTAPADAEPTALVAQKGTAEVAVATSSVIENPQPLVTPTYDGSGEAVHPDVVDAPDGWGGRRYWMTFTPYRRSNERLENPSVVASGDGRTFTVPAGLRNPIVDAPRAKKDYNSDPELVREPTTNRLTLFYRQVTRDANTIFSVGSADGVRWSAPTRVVAVPAHAMVSPTVAAPEDGQPARLWYVDAGKQGCKAPSTVVYQRTAAASSPVATARWGTAVATTLAQPGYVVWHLKVRWIPSQREYWAVYAAYPKGPKGCDVNDLFFARSRDGVSWTTYAEPLFRHGDRQWTAASLYRSSFTYDAASDQLRLWISARDAAGAWRVGHARLRWATLPAELGDGKLDARAGSTPGAWSAYSGVGSGEVDGDGR